MDHAVIPALDPSDIRRSAEARSRRWLVPGLGLGLLAVVGAGVGTYEFLDRSIASPRAQAIRIGPVADMPEIKDGVPALAAKGPVRVIPTTAPPAREDSLAAPAALVQAAAALPAAAAEPADPAREAADAKVMALTVAAASLRPGFPDRQPDGPALAPPEPDGAGMRAALEPDQPASPTPLATAPDPQARAAGSRDPDASGRADSYVAAETPAAAAALPPKAATQGAALPGPLQLSPLPPTRPAPRAAEAQPLPDRGTQGRPRPALAPAPPAPAPTASAALVQPAPAGPAPGARRAPVPPGPETERAEIFGVPLPGFLPTGREIREAAGTVADAVTSIPDLF